MQMKSGKGYDENLQWMGRSDEFDRDQKAIILTCSRKNKVWIKYSLIEKQSGLPTPVLFEELMYLIKINVIKVKVSQDQQILFALRERL